MKDVVKETRDKMTTLLHQRYLELEKCQHEIEAARGVIEAAELTRQDATEKMDVKQYGDAKKKIDTARTTIEMYTARTEQIKRCELISESESDDIIDALLAHEHEIANTYEANARNLIDRLRDLTEDYQHEVSTTEALIKEWTARIHPNYRKYGTTYPNGTNHGDIPVPVRLSPYYGSPLSLITRDYVKHTKTVSDDTRLSLLGDTH